MGYKAYVRIVNNVEHGNELSCEEPNELLKDLELLEEESGKYLFQWQDENNDDFEFNYDIFMSAFEKYYSPEKYSKALKEVYEEAKRSENSRKNGFIRIDWF